MLAGSGDHTQQLDAMLGKFLKGEKGEDDDVKVELDPKVRDAIHEK